MILESNLGKSTLVNNQPVTLIPLKHGFVFVSKFKTNTYPKIWGRTRRGDIIPRPQLYRSAEELDSSQAS